MIKISENNIQLWLMDFELWQLPLELWQLPLELWQLPLALWHYSKSNVDVLGTLATASGALATASRALATASRTLANISSLSNKVFVFWQLPGISSASSDSLFRQPHQTALSEIFLDTYLKWIGLLCQKADTWCCILWFEMKLTHKWPFYDHFWSFFLHLYVYVSQNGMPIVIS